MNISIMNWSPLLYLKAGRKNGWIKNFWVRKMTKPVSLFEFEIVDHKYFKNCRQSTMWWNIEKWNIQLKNRKCIPSIEARSTKRGYESIVKYCFFIVLGFNRYMVECEYCIRIKNGYRWHGFNRYMVECEFRTGKKNSWTFWVLIDTWWNVNQLLETIQSLATAVLIDTWWNVNSEFASWEGWHKKVLIDTWWNVNRWNIFFNH